MVPGMTAISETGQPVHGMTGTNRIAVSLLFVVVILLSADLARAGKVEFIKDHTYRAGDMDSKVSSRAIALLEVKRALLEQLGTYLVSETEVRNFQLTKDQISVMTAGIVSAEIIDERWDGREFYLKAKLIVDPQDVAERVRAISKDRERTRELEEARRRSDQAFREVERLKKDMGLARPDIQGQVDRQADYSRAVQELGVDEGFAGHRFLMKDGYSFIWTQYEESGDSYCTYHTAGRICIPKRDVASIKRGQYPENAEVISGKPADEWSRRKAEKDWKAIQVENERTKKTLECSQLSQELKLLRRDTAEYAARYDEYQEACSSVKLIPQPTQSKSGASERKVK
jgi:hypothetical protein